MSLLLLLTGLSALLSTLLLTQAPAGRVTALGLHVTRQRRWQRPLAVTLALGVLTGAVLTAMHTGLSAGMIALAALGLLSAALNVRTTRR